MDERRDNNIRHLDQCGTGQNSMNVSFCHFALPLSLRKKRGIILTLTISKAILPGNG